MIEDYHDIIRTYNPENNTTKPLLTKFEKVKIIGIRAEQIQRGAPPYVEFDKNNFDPIKIATKELDLRKLPFMILRKLPNGEKEYWRLDDMIF